MLCAEAHLLAGDVDRAAVLFAESSALAVTMSNTDSFVLSESGLAVLAMDGGRWAAAAEHVQRALGAIDEHRMHDYATSLLAFAAAARLAVHRGDAMEVDLWVPETTHTDADQVIHRRGCQSMIRRWRRS